LLSLIASTWVDLYHAAFVSRHSLEQENEQLRMYAVQKDLDGCYDKLACREAELQERVLMLGEQALNFRRKRNLPGAKKKMLERARILSQLERIQNSIAMIEMHRSTIEGTALDLSVLETLKASGNALKQLGATGQGLRNVEDIVSEVESHLQHASEITSVLSAGSVSGLATSALGAGGGMPIMLNGAPVDEDDLMRELDEMLLDEDGESHHGHCRRPRETRSAADEEQKKPPVRNESSPLSKQPQDQRRLGDILFMDSISEAEDDDDEATSSRAALLQAAYPRSDNAMC